MRVRRLFYCVITARRTILTVRWLVVLELLVTGDAAMPGVGESVVVLVHHGQALAGAEVELLPCETVLQYSHVRWFQNSQSSSLQTKGGFLPPTFLSGNESMVWLTVSV